VSFRIQILGLILASATSAAVAHAERLKHRTDPDTWIPKLITPPMGQRHSIDAVVTYRLLVSPDGRVSGCTIIKSSNLLEVDQFTCRILVRRARFCPWVDDIFAPRFWTGRYHWKARREIVTQAVPPGSEALNQPSRSPVKVSGRCY
jgi:outer membrane biosynthesis protein TonB